MNQEDRLLTEEEFTDAQIKYIERYKATNYGVILNFPLEGWLRHDCIQKAQDTKSYAQALKDVGEWLIEDCDEFRDRDTEEVDYYGVKPEQAKALKQGTMPE